MGMPEVLLINVHPVLLSGILESATGTDRRYSAFYRRPDGSTQTVRLDSLWAFPKPGPPEEGLQDRKIPCIVAIVDAWQSEDPSDLLPMWFETEVLHKSKCPCGFVILGPKDGQHLMRQKALCRLIHSACQIKDQERRLVQYLATDCVGIPCDPSEIEASVRAAWSACLCLAERIPPRDTVQARREVEIDRRAVRRLGQDRPKVFISYSNATEGSLGERTRRVVDSFDEKLGAWFNVDVDKKGLCDNLPPQEGLPLMVDKADAVLILASFNYACKGQRVDNVSSVFKAEYERIKSRKKSRDVFVLYVNLDLTTDQLAEFELDEYFECVNYGQPLLDLSNEDLERTEIQRLAVEFRRRYRKYAGTSSDIGE